MFYATFKFTMLNWVCRKEICFKDENTSTSTINTRKYNKTLTYTFS
jgi:hypothetical protein